MTPVVLGLRSLARARRFPLAVLCACALLAWPAIAAAHDSSLTYGELQRSPDGRAIDYTLQIRTTDLGEALDTDVAEPDEATLRAAEAHLYDYVLARVTLAAPGQRCALERRPLAIVTQRDRFVRLAVTLRCPEPVAKVELDYGLFHDLDPAHVGFLRVEGETVQLRAPDDNRMIWDVAAPPHTGLGGFLAGGVRHIVGGLDHVLFLISLLLIAVIQARPRLEARRFPATLRATAGIVTAFTVAHSLTLVASALGWVELPRRLVESVIAASILYVAIENVVRPDPRHRLVITFVFGLVHGLGIAAELAPALPPDGILVPLLIFNLGVELGQLAIVVVALPLLLTLVRVLGPTAYRRHVVLGGALAIGALATFWLVERAFALELLSP
jgi:hypothetical protein